MQIAGLTESLRFRNHEYHWKSFVVSQMVVIDF